MAIYNPNIFSIIALTGTVLTGIVPLLKYMIGDIARCGFEFVTLIHVLSGALGAVGVGLALGDDSRCNNFTDWDRIYLLTGAALSNIISSGAAHQYFVDRQNEYNQKEKDFIEYGVWFTTLAMSIGTALAHFGSDKRMDSQNIYNIECENRELYWLFIISPLVLILLFILEFFITEPIQNYNSPIRYYTGAAMVVISSFAITITGYYVLDVIIFGLIIGRMGYVHAKK